MMTSRRSTGGGAELCGSDGLLVLGKHGKQGKIRLVVALLLVVISTIADHGHCITPAPAPGVPSDPAQQGRNFLICDSDEADALVAIYKNWTALQLNPQLTTVLNWTSEPSPHPCSISNLSVVLEGRGFTLRYPGAWGGIECALTSLVPDENATGNYYHAAVTGLYLNGGASTCEWSFHWCDRNFTGIKGVLPAAISRLVHLDTLRMSHNPKLTGPIPLEIWQMPSLGTLWLVNNSLSGTLPSHVSYASSQLYRIILRSNNLSGRLQVSLDGTLFGAPNLEQLDLRNNQLDGTLDFQSFNNTSKYGLLSMYLSNNRFNGTFSTGSHFNPYFLTLSKNEITSMKFANYTKPDYDDLRLQEGNVVYMPNLQELIIDNNKLSGPFPMEVMQMPSLKILNVSFNNFNGTISLGPYLNVETLDLSNNHFKNITFETYNGSKVYMPEMKELHIQNNNFSGVFPSEILKAPLLQTLYGDHNQYETLHLPESVELGTTVLNNLVLTYNKFEDVQYPNIGLFATFNLQVSNILFLGGNPMCKHIRNRLLATVCRWNQTSSLPPVVSKPGSNNRNIIIGICTSTTIMLLMAALYVWKLMHRISSLRNILAEFEKKEVKPNLYSYKEIKLATKNFDKRNKLGEGGFGIVYKGELFDGTTVAVKKLTMSSSQGLTEFLNEVVVISNLKHRNLVKLKGCCFGDGDQRMLVFEYVENKNLGEALWMEELSKPSYLDWTTRFNILIGTARGLAYLHEEVQPPVIHRDIKAANILLDKNYIPKIADFGLAYLFPILDNEDTHLTLVEIAGTRYMF